jgi:hypothetical protein
LGGASGWPFLIAHTLIMQNPWVEIPKRAPYLLPSDREAICSFNAKCKPEHKIRLDVLPQPYAGNVKTAQAYLLNLNPGFEKKDIYWQQNLKTFKQANLNSLRGNYKNGFYFLDNKFKQTGAYRWWHKILNQVINVWGEKRTINELMCVELFPYHSLSYKQIKKNIPSQEYSFYLVRQAIKKSKPIIIMRRQDLWLKAVPELKHYPYVVLKNKQRPWISKNNVPKNKFDKIFN